MKIMQINCVYKKGSTGKITHDIHNGLLARGLESVVLYGRGANIKTEKTSLVHKVCSEWYGKLNNLLSRFSGIMYGGCPRSTDRIIREIECQKPEVVHLQCINGFFVNIYRLLTYLKQHQIPTVLTLHAEFMYTGGCGYAFSCNKWEQEPGCQKCPRFREETGSLLLDRTGEMWKRMKGAMEGFERLVVVSVSPWLKERAARASVMKCLNHCVVLNGLDVSVFKPKDAGDIRRELHLEKEKVIFHVSPEFTDDPAHNKGGYYVLELAKCMPEVRFVVAGNYRIKAEVPRNVTLLGNVANQETLAKLYSLADVTLLTSKRETFSMVCAESLCCGTPVAGFCAGAPEGIALREYSRFVNHGDLDALQNAVTQCFLLKCDEIRARAVEKYDREKMVDSYIEIYNQLVEKG